jgi:hypothetical protein
MTASIHVTFKSRFGLCNRLRGLAGYYALSKSLNQKLFYTWEADPSCPGLIDEVFLPIPGAIPVTQLPAADDQTLSIGTSSSPLQPTHCGSPPELTFQAHCQGHGHGHGQVSRATFDAFVGEFYQLLIPINAVVQRVEALMKNNETSETPSLGVHIRRTDMVDLRARKGLLPLQNVIPNYARSFLDRHPAGKVFLACDNPSSLEQARTILGPRALSLEHHWIEANRAASEDTSKQARLTGLFDAVCDLYMLANCDSIIGTVGSSFSAVAGQWGGKPTGYH